MRWQREDEIRWVEHELRRSRFGAKWEKSPLSDNPVGLELWLAKARDQKSWKEVGGSFFPRLNPEARRSEARRVYGRVERYLENPNTKEFQGHRLKQLIEETFGVSVEDFRAFILGGHLPRTRKRRAKKK